MECLIPEPQYIKTTSSIIYLNIPPPPTNYVDRSAQRLGETLNNLCPFPSGKQHLVFLLSFTVSLWVSSSELLFACSYSHFSVRNRIPFQIEGIWLAHFTLVWEEVFAGQPMDCCLWVSCVPVIQSAIFEQGSSGVKHGGPEGEQLPSERDCGHDWQVTAHDIVTELHN